MLLYTYYYVIVPLVDKEAYGVTYKCYFHCTISNQLIEIL